MSVFVTGVKKDLQYGDLMVTIRKLSGSSLRDAQDARQMLDFRKLRAMGGELFRVVREPRPEPSETTSARPATPEEKKRARLETKRKERYAAYDRDDMLNRGIESWSAAVDVATGFKQLEDQIQEQIFQEIVDLALGPVDDDEVEEGKG